jgi:hypothetical protein
MIVREESGRALACSPRCFFVERPVLHAELSEEQKPSHDARAMRIEEETNKEALPEAVKVCIVKYREDSHPNLGS